MSDLKIEFETSKKSMCEIRPALEELLPKQFPGGMLASHWDGDVLRLSGPGAQGSIFFLEGRLVGEASLKPPASMMRVVIEEKITAVMKQAAA